MFDFRGYRDNTCGFDFRNYREVIKEAVAAIRKADPNWPWYIRRINKYTLALDWAYSKYIGETSPFVIQPYFDDGEVISFLGYLPDAYHYEAWSHVGKNNDGDISDCIRVVISRLLKVAYTRY